MSSMLTTTKGRVKWRIDLSSNFILPHSEDKEIENYGEVENNKEVDNNNNADNNIGSSEMKDWSLE